MRTTRGSRRPWTAALPVGVSVVLLSCTMVSGSSEEGGGSSAQEGPEEACTFEWDDYRASVGLLNWVDNKTAAAPETVTCPVVPSALTLDAQHPVSLAMTKSTPAGEYEITWNGGRIGQKVPARVKAYLQMVVLTFSPTDEDSTLLACACPTAGCECRGAECAGCDAYIFRSQDSRKSWQICLLPEKTDCIDISKVEARLPVGAAVTERLTSDAGVVLLELSVAGSGELSIGTAPSDYAPLGATGCPGVYASIIYQPTCDDPCDNANLCDSMNFSQAQCFTPGCGWVKTSSGSRCERDRALCPDTLYY
jgi:hypothetical protein